MNRAPATPRSPCKRGGFRLAKIRSDPPEGPMRAQFVFPAVPDGLGRTHVTAIQKQEGAIGQRFRTAGDDRDRDPGSGQRRIDFAAAWA